jgi:Fe-S cluster assembly ATP-binding protein
MLELKNLSVSKDGIKILKDVSLEVGPGEILTVFGPNGSGKSTLLKAIAGIPGYFLDGEILFEGALLNPLSLEDRAKRGVSLGFQQPTDIPGITLRQLLKICSKKEEFSEDEKHLISKFRMEGFLDRDLNVHFSGGEKKRAEILQILFMKPKLLLLDEPDSGVDIESLKLIATEIQEYISKSRAMAILVTHQGTILNHMASQKGCVLVEGKVACHEEPKKIFDLVSREGYKACIRCEHGSERK